MNHPADTEYGSLAQRARASACALIGLSLLLSSCATSPPPEPVPVASPAPVPEPPPPPEPKRKKAPAPPKRFVMTPEMDEKLARPLLSLLEREAQIQNLEKKLDDAIQETVRSKAKLVSQESRAEAATNFAEAEVALKTLKGSEKRPDYAHMDQLMKTSLEELKKENYGGSLYLTNQVKAQLKELQDRVESEQRERSGAGAAGKPSASSEFDVKLTRLQTLSSEKDAQAQKLHRKLDDTIQEAVRTKSKLRSQENKADAASSFAEAETALKTFKDALSGSERRPELSRAQALMKLSAEELKKENYSGTLYAANQVKAIVQDLQDHAQGRDTLTQMDGEVLFALPLPLKIAASGKIRERPAADAVVVWSVERGASPTAVSYKGPWIRVKGEGDRWGWMFYNLIAIP